MKGTLLGPAAGALRGVAILSYAAPPRQRAAIEYQSTPLVVSNHAGRYAICVASGPGGLYHSVGGTPNVIEWKEQCHPWPVHTRFQDLALLGVPAIRSYTNAHYAQRGSLSIHRQGMTAGKHRITGPHLAFEWDISTPSRQCHTTLCTHPWMAQRLVRAVALSLRQSKAKPRLSPEWLDTRGDGH